MSKEIKIIEPSGRLDVSNVAKFRVEISEAVADSPSGILIDLKEVNFMDSSGLGALVSALKIVRSAQGELFLCSLNEPVKMLFDLTSMSKIFKIYPDRATFLKEMG